MRSEAQARMYKLQEQIRNNANDTNETVHELMSWSSEINNKEKKGVNK